MRIPPKQACEVAPELARPGRLMWITPDRIFYSGLLGAPSSRTMGAYMLYVATAGQVHVKFEGGDWQAGQVAVAPPYAPHQVVSDQRQIHVVQVDAEAVDAAQLPALLKVCGVAQAPGFGQAVRNAYAILNAGSASPSLGVVEFDRLFFGCALPSRQVDRRIQSVIDRIKADPSGAATAEECAEFIHLSVSRFLHLFKQEVGVPFRSFRTWKRARSLLHHVNRGTNLAHVAQATGYPDSTHFSHSIRAVFGLKPKDIFAGSRKLVLMDQRPPQMVGARA